MDAEISSGEFRFLPMERVAYGPGAVRGLPQALDRRALSRAMVITGESISTRTDLLWYVEQLLGPRHAATYTGARQHVPSATVAEAVELAQAAGADCLVSLGGGSPIDTAKAVAYRLAHGESRPRDRAGVTGPDGPPPLPHFAVPTTLGAGEFTATAGITDEETRIKGGVADRALTPLAVFLDPQMTLATPERLWLSTGIKALDHAVEVYCSPAHMPLTDALTLEAVRLLFAGLPRTRERPDDLEARLRCQLAAWMSLFGAGSVRTGLSHALGHQIGARCDVPHGITSCITLPHVLRYTAPAIPARQAALARAIDPAAAGSDHELAALAAERVAELVAGLGLPAGLRDAGVPEAEIGPIAQAAFHEIGSRPLVRPVESIDHVTALLQKMW